MRQVYGIPFAQHGIKNSKFYKECMTSLALLPPRDFANLKDNFPLNIIYKELEISLAL